MENIPTSGTGGNGKKVRRTFGLEKTNRGGSGKKQKIEKKVCRQRELPKGVGLEQDPPLERRWLREDLGNSNSLKKTPQSRVAKPTKEGENSVTV